MGKPNLLTLFIAGSALEHSKVFKRTHFWARIFPSLSDTATPQIILTHAPQPIPDRSCQFALQAVQYKRTISTLQSFCSETLLCWPNLVQCESALLNLILWPYFKIQLLTRSGAMAMYNIRGICQFRKGMTNYDRRPFYKGGNLIFQCIYITSVMGTTYWMIYIL